MKSCLFLCALLPVLAELATAQITSPSVTSPDGRLVIKVETRDVPGRKQASQPEVIHDQLTYSVTFNGKPVIDASAMRLDFEGESPLGTGVRIVNASPSTHDSNYELLFGKTKTVRDHYNASLIELKEIPPARRKLNLEIRAYDDAIAFRYAMPQQIGRDQFRLAGERTEFRISKDGTAYAMVLPNYLSMYESEFLKLPISSFSNQGGVPSKVLIGLPTLIDIPGVAWLAITEADLKDYSSMYLTNPSGNWGGHYFESRLAPDITNPDVAVTGRLPHHSAWRVLMIGEQPGRLIESNVIMNLNPESAIQDTSWIRPGRAAWDWWSGSIGRDGKPAFTTDTMKYYVDFASSAGLEYMQIDAGWAQRGDITKMNGKVDVPEVVKYGAQKNVKVWIWLHWSDVERQMEEAFQKYEEWGVAGLKIDFMSRDDQGMLRWYYRVAECAARHHLMIDYHGATKPWGLERTYPNVVGYEAVLGMEQNKGGARDTPDHHVTIPFTRMLAGPMDYTPGGFRNATREQFEIHSDRPIVMGTRAHQLAMYVAFESPYQMVSDEPSAYRDQPAFEFIKDVPATWDETKVIAGRPGEFITIARRKGDDWFVGSMTGWTHRDLDVPLTFLGNKKFRATIYADAEDANEHPTNVRISAVTVDGNSHLPVKLANGGGYAVRFTPLKK